MLENKNEIVRVIFRTWPDGTVVAVFPEHPGDNAGHECETWRNSENGSVYDTVGFSILAQLTRPATDNEAARLTTELEELFDYSVVRIYRESAKMVDVRCAALLAQRTFAA